MGSSFIKFRGRGFWARDTQLQAAMYLLYCELAAWPDLTAPLIHLRDTLILQAVHGGCGCVYCGLDDYPEDEPWAPLASMVRGAQLRQPTQLTGFELATARVAMSDYPGAEKFWHGIESDEWNQHAVAMILSAFLELVSGEVTPQFGQLVHPSESEDANSRTLPFGDVRMRQAAIDAEWAAILSKPPSTSSFGPDARVQFVSRPSEREKS